MICRICGRLFPDGIPEGAKIVRETAFWTLITLAGLAHVLVEAIIEKPVDRVCCKSTGCSDPPDHLGFCDRHFYLVRNRRLARWRARKAA